MPQTVSIPFSARTSLTRRLSVCTAINLSPNSARRLLANSIDSASRSNPITRLSGEARKINSLCPPSPSVASMNNPPRAASRPSSVSRVITGRWSSINSTGTRETLRAKIEDRGWGIEDRGSPYAMTLSSILSPQSSFLASPEPETSNTEPRQRLRIFIRVRLLFQARAAEIFGVPYFQIFQISEDHHLASQVRFVAQHRVDQDPSLPVHRLHLPIIVGAIQKLPRGRDHRGLIGQLFFNFLPLP